MRRRQGDDGGGAKDPGRRDLTEGREEEEEGEERGRERLIAFTPNLEPLSRIDARGGRSLPSQGSPLNMFATENSPPNAAGEEVRINGSNRVEREEGLDKVRACAEGE